MSTNTISSRYLLWSGLAIVIIIGLAITLKLAGGEPQKFVSTDTLAVPVSANDWRVGPATSTVTLVEYADFQCPACASYDPTLKRVMADYRDRVTFVYRHFPLAQHKEAILAATVAEAAGRQGKFWEMASIIYENQAAWAAKPDAANTMLRLVQTLKLDLNKFQADLKDGVIADKITEQYNGGLRSGVNATPTFFLNGKKVMVPNTYDDFKRILDAALANPAA